MELLQISFQKFAVHGDTKASGKELNGKNWAKLCKDCGIIDGKNVTSTDVDIVFSKVKWVSSVSPRGETTFEGWSRVYWSHRKRFCCPPWFLNCSNTIMRLDWCDVLLLCLLSCCVSDRKRPESSPLRTSRGLWKAWPQRGLKVRVKKMLWGPSSAWLRAKSPQISVWRWEHSFVQGGTNKLKGLFHWLWLSSAQLLSAFTRWHKVLFFFFFFEPRKCDVNTVEATDWTVIDNTEWIVRATLSNQITPTN